MVNKEGAGKRRRVVSKEERDRKGRRVVRKEGKGEGERQGREEGGDERVSGLGKEGRRRGRKVEASCSCDSLAGGEWVEREKDK